MNTVSSTKKLVSAGALMAAGTLISRILGVVKVTLIGFILGYGTRQADMLTLATMVPNSIYILLVGGALNTVLVPQIVRAMKDDPDGGEAYTNRMMTAFMLIVTVSAIVVTAAAPLVAAIYVDDAWRAETLTQQYQSIIALTYLTLPQIFFFGIFFLIGQILNAREQYAPMMWAPIANNVVGIAVLCLYFVVWGNGQDHSQAFTSSQLLVLGIGMTLGIMVQVLVLLPYAKRVGFRLRPRFDLRGSGLGKTFSLAKWTLGFVAVSQLAVVIVTRLATTATASGAGAGVNVYNNTLLVFLLPHSLITVSLATAMLTQASKLAAAGELSLVATEFTKTTRLALVAIVPAVAAFLALASPVVSLLFGYGSGSADAGYIAWTLLAFAVGLVPFTIQFMCMRAFYALENTRTPFMLQTVIAGVNIVGGFVLVGVTNLVFGQRATGLIAPALALAYSISFGVGAWLTWAALSRQLPGLSARQLGMHVLRLVLACAVGGVPAYFLVGWLLPALGGGKIAALLATVSGGVLILAAFVLVGRALGIKELSSLSALVAGKLGRNRGEDATQRPGAVLPAPEMPWDDAPTQIFPALRMAEYFDDPPTIIRNRPPLGEHSFDHLRIPSVEEVVVAPDVDQEYEEDETTGRIDMAALFRDADRGRIATVGTLLHARYEVVELLAQRHGTETWRAHDQVLSRDVVVHVIAAGDPRIDALLVAARKGAAATDSRFLRVLDADVLPDTGDGIGAYVVAEYAAGRSLTQLLAKGPLSSIEAAHIARELADALAGVHAAGLFHEQVNPENVIITTTGAVRLVGFGTEAALAGGQSATSWNGKESADVLGVAKVLYATLVRHWPGGLGWGLPAAPLVAGETAPAGTLLPGISPALDRICSATLTQQGAAGQQRITTAAQLTGVLTEVLGTADATLDLEQRVRAWSSSGDAPLEASSAYVEEPTSNVVFAPSPPEDVVVQQEYRPRRGLWLIFVLALLALVVSLALVLVNSLRGGPPSDPGPVASGSPDPGSGQGAPLAVESITDFDPVSDNGDDEEGSDTVAQAIDGDPGTAWRTTRYHNRSNMGGLKPGVGLLLDLGQERNVSAVNLTINGPTTVQFRVPKTAEASTRTEADWEIAASAEAVEGAVTLSPTAPVQTRWVLIYLTDVPQVADNRYQGQIAEIEVRG